MTELRDRTLSLSERELHELQSALWHWEDTFRSGRYAAKHRGEDVREHDRRIGEIRNLKARLFRVKAS